MKNYLLLLIILCINIFSLVQATEINPAAYRTMQMQNYQQRRYQQQIQNQQIKPYWQIRSNYTTRNQYYNYMDYSKRSQYNQYYRGK